MPEKPNRAPPKPKEIAADRVDSLASQALSVVAARIPRNSKPMSEDLLRRLNCAALSTDTGSCAQAISEMIAEGIRREDIADHYIPQLARRMGEAWNSDEMSFAEVTIGVSRLQAMLRELGPTWTADRSAAPDAPALLLLVPHDVHHTLGALVVSGQLRRRGISVRLMLGARAEDVVNILRHGAFDAVFISASLGDSFDTLRRLVDGIRAARSERIQIVIGGNILDAGEDIRGLTGADHATNDPALALELCGLKINSPDYAPDWCET